MYRKRADGSFNKHVVYSVSAVLSIIQKFIPTIDHIAERLPYHLTIMFSFIIQQLHRLFINRSQYACYIILAPLLLYLVRFQAFQDTFSLYLLQLTYFQNKPFSSRILVRLKGHGKLIAHMRPTEYELTLRVYLCQVLVNHIAIGLVCFPGKFQ